MALRTTLSSIVIGLFIFRSMKQIKNVFFNKLNVARSSQSKGFTLIEILVVIGIIALLATIVIIAINPARQFAQARNTQRESNINTILNAIGQNIADHKGVFDCAGVNTLPVGLATSSIDNGAGGAAPKVDLSCLAPTYVPALASDPTATSTIATGYFVSVDASGRVSVCAPSANEAALGTPGALCVKR